MTRVAYDDEPCPVRGPFLTHVGIPTCFGCGAETEHRPPDAADSSGAPTERFTPREHLPDAPHLTGVPARHFREYRAALAEGFAPREAQALIAIAHGLPPVGGHPWTLRELDRLLAVRAWVDSGRMGS